MIEIFNDEEYKHDEHEFEHCFNDYNECFEIDCEELGRKIIKSALKFEDALSEVVKKEKETYKFIKNHNPTENQLKAMKLETEKLEAICCIEKQIIKKLKLGIKLTCCECPEG